MSFALLYILLCIRIFGKQDISQRWKKNIAVVGPLQSVKNLTVLISTPCPWSVSAVNLTKSRYPRFAFPQTISSQTDRMHPGDTRRDCTAAQIAVCAILFDLNWLKTAGKQRPPSTVWYSRLSTSVTTSSQGSGTRHSTSDPFLEKPLPLGYIQGKEIDQMPSSRYFKLFHYQILISFLPRPFR